MKKIAKNPEHFLREDPKSHFPRRIKPRSMIPAESPEVANTSRLFLTIFPKISPGERILN